MNNERQVWLVLALGAVAFFLMALGVRILEDLPLVGLAGAAVFRGGQLIEDRWRPQLGPRGRPRLETWLTVAVLSLWAWIFVSQIAGTVVTWSDKADFRRIASQGPSGVNYESHTWQFGGRLDDVVARRQVTLRKAGLIGFGVWYAADIGTKTPMLYLWVGPFRWLS